MFFFVSDASLSFLPHEPLDSFNLEDDLSATCVFFQDAAPCQYNEITIKFNTVPFKTIRFHVAVNEVTCEDIKMWFPLTNKYNHECESGTVQISGSSRICSYFCQCQTYHGLGSGGCNTFTLLMIKMGSVCDISVKSHLF